MKEYKITFANHSEYLSSDELRNFVNVAVIHNKDINNFTVERLTPEKYVDELVEAYISDYDTFSTLFINIANANLSFVDSVLKLLEHDDLVVAAMYREML